MNNKIKAIISGSDGTLIDSLYMIRRGQYEAAVEYMVDRGIARRELPQYDDFERFVNRSVGGRTRDTMQKTLSLLLAKEGKKLPEIDFDELERRLGPIQDRLAPLYLHPFYGLSAFLSWLGENNIDLGVFTSSSRYQLIRNWGNALPALGYTNLFLQASVSEDEKIEALKGRIKATFNVKKLSIVTSSDVTATKPDPEGISKVLAELNYKPEEVIMVGDLDADIIAGKRAGVLSVGIAHGFGTAKELEAAGADKVVKDLAELRSFVDELNGRQPQSRAV